MAKQFILEEFLPYRLSVAAKNISMKFSENYCEQFNISVQEWRVLAVVGQQPELSAEEVSERTTMEKVAVSRAVAKLLDKSIIKRRFSSEDRRRSQLSLEEKGLDIYQQIVPIAQEFERSLLESFSDDEAGILMKVLTKLESGTLKKFHPHH